MNKTDFAYAAGYIDGDGCFAFQRPWASHLIISSTNKTALNWFLDNFKGTLTCHKRNDGIRRPAYYFRFSEKGLEFLPYIHDFLVEKNKECVCFQNFRSCSGEKEKKPFIEEMNFLKYKFGLIPSSIKEELEPIKSTINPMIEDFAYLAGYIDAECSLDINRKMQSRGKTYTYRPQLQCNNSKSPFFYWSAARFGGQFHFLDKSHIPNCRNQMLWRIANLQLDPILKGIYPFLKSKKTICNKIIELRTHTFSGKGRKSPNHPEFTQWYEQIAETRKSIYDQVRYLNKIV